MRQIDLQEYQQSEAIRTDSIDRARRIFSDGITLTH